MKIEIDYTGGSRFLARSSTHTVVSDQPIENGGSDTGMTPPELLLAALGTCAGYYAAQYRKIRKLPAEGLTVTVNAEKATQPARVGFFKIEVNLQAALEARHLTGIERAVHSCLIHNTLLQPPRIEIAVQTGEADRKSA